MKRLPGIFLSALGLLSIAMVTWSFVNRQQLALPEEKSMTVDAYHGVAVAGSFEVEVTRGPQGPVQLSGANLENVEVKVNDGVLQIGCKKDCGQVQVKITVPNLDQVEIAGSGVVRSKDALGGGKDLRLSIAGSGHIESAVDAGKVKADISGSGKIRCTGKSEATMVSIAGSGHFDGSDLKAREAKVDISGSGMSEIYASEQATANVSGSGRVMVHGNPTELSKSVSGSGKVEKM